MATSISLLPTERSIVTQPFPPTSSESTGWCTLRNCGATLARRWTCSSMKFLLSARASEDEFAWKLRMVFTSDDMPTRRELMHWLWGLADSFTPWNALRTAEDGLSKAACRSRTAAACSWASDGRRRERALHPDWSKRTPSTATSGWTFCKSLATCPATSRRSASDTLAGVLVFLGSAIRTISPSTRSAIFHRAARFCKPPKHWFRWAIACFCRADDERAGETVSVTFPPTPSETDTVAMLPKSSFSASLIPSTSDTPSTVYVGVVCRAAILCCWEAATRLPHCDIIRYRFSSPSRCCPSRSRFRKAP
eukprot:Sspe_Gene.53725::Locus_29670_Transcript_1_1_Confidence_1.000_Length_2092::g.53725::m.53725